MFKQQQHGKAKAYGNVKKVERHGILFDSPWEADRYDELVLLQRAGKIRNLEARKSALRYDFVHPVTNIRVGRYTPDFRYEEKVEDLLGEHWNVIVEDVKGYQSATETAYRLRLQMMKAWYRIDVRETGYDPEKAKQGRKAKREKKKIEKRIDQRTPEPTPCTFACTYSACEGSKRCVMAGGHQGTGHVCGYHFAERLRRQGAAKR